MKTKLFSQVGKELEDVTLNKAIFGIKPHNQAMFDSVISHLASLRQGTSQVKNRSDVRGGGKKPWKQKGTGRSRQGTIRAPQWVGGGVVFGPQKNANYSKKVNKKVKKLGFLSYLSLKAKEKNIIVVDKIEFKKRSTKAMLDFINKLKINNQKVIIVTEKFSDDLYYSLANVPYLDHTTPSGLNVHDLAYYDKIVFSKKALENLEKGWK